MTAGVVDRTGSTPPPVAEWAARATRPVPVAPQAALWLTGTLLTVLCLLGGLLVLQTYRDVMSDAHARAEGAARTVSAHVGWLIEASLQTLERIDDAVAEHPTVLQASDVGDLLSYIGPLPREVAATVFNANGDVILSSEPRLGRANLSDREYFQQLRDGAPWLISPMITAKLTGRKIFVVTRRIVRDGAFMGGAVITIPASLVAGFWADLELGPDSTAGLFNSDGWLVARYPLPETTINLSQYELFTEHLKRAPSGSYPAMSPADGIRRVVGYHSVPGVPLVALAGLSLSQVQAAFWTRVGIGALVAVPTMVALIGISIWVGVLLRRYEVQREALAASLEENRVLFREIHHRVKNNLQTVASLIRLQGLPAETRQEVTSRIAAMTAVHEQLYESDRFDRLDVARYVRGLVEQLEAASVGPVAVTTALEPVTVSPDKAIPLGLVINEVVSNAFKHAFPDGRRGTVAITLRRADPGTAVLEIRDDGVGFDPAASRNGMGSRLVTALARQIGAEAQYVRENGMRFVLRLPLEGVPSSDANPVPRRLAA